MKLSKEEQAILDGSEGETKAKIMRTIVEFGDVFGAKRLVPVTHDGHLVTSFGIGLIKPLFRIMDEIIDAGIKAQKPFTVDPRPIDYKNVKCNILNKLIFSKIMYSQQARYEEQLKKIGLKNEDGFTCTCYHDEVGNVDSVEQKEKWFFEAAKHIVRPDVVFLATCPANLSIKRIKGRADECNRYFDEELLKRVHNEFLKMSKVYSFNIINTDRAAVEAFKDVREVMEAQL